MNKKCTTKTYQYTNALARVTNAQMQHNVRGVI